MQSAQILRGRRRYTGPSNPWKLAPCRKKMSMLHFDPSVATGMRKLHRHQQIRVDLDGYSLLNEVDIEHDPGFTLQLMDKAFHPF